MPIVGFNFDNISASRDKDLKGEKVKIRSNMEITSVSSKEISLGEDQKQDVVKIDFEYNVYYDPQVGSVGIKGHMLYSDNAKKVKEILTSWKKDKKVELGLKAQLINAALIKSNIKALGISQEVNLPPHLPMPTVSPHAKKAEEYIG